LTVSRPDKAHSEKSVIIRRVIRSLAPLPLEQDSAHVWIFSTDRTRAECNALRATLSPEENARADRFMFEGDRSRFIVAHAVLRVQLATYSGTRPEALVFSLGPQGKPFILEPSVPIQFNLSHSGSRAAIVVTLHLQCGIDIQETRSVSHEDIAERFFCEREQAWLESLPEENRQEGFFRLWSTKEAILKAGGNGFSTPLNAVDTTNVLNGISPYVSLNDEDGRGLSLWVRELDTTPGYSMALAVEGRAPNIRLFDLDTCRD
jgi:4'-phosphopantetheinyl transferase